MSLLVLRGLLANFINIIPFKSDAYCGACGAIVGSALLNGSVEIRSQHLIRIDPRWLVSVCLGRTSENGVLIPHMHFPLMATFINLPANPILPLQVRSIRNGILLKDTCPFARNFIDNPPCAPFSEQFFSDREVRIREYVDLTGDAPTESENYSYQSENTSVTEDAIDKLTDELLGQNTSNLENSPFLSLVSPDSELHEEIRLSAEMSSTVVPNETTSGILVLNNDELSAFLQDQPSTSHGRYSFEIEAVKNANEMKKDQRSFGNKRSHPDYWNAVCEHSYVRSVSIIIFIYIYSFIILYFIHTHLCFDRLFIPIVLFYPFSPKLILPIMSINNRLKVSKIFKITRLILNLMKLCKL